MSPKELKKLRESLNLDFEQMGAKLGIGWRQYRYIESGEKPISKASELLAKRLKMEMKK